MNYFAHGRRFLQDAGLLAGTAVPDWLSVVNRKVRARSRMAKVFVDDRDPHLAAVARGIVQHHHDDGWFHQTRAFTELSWQFTVEIRHRLVPDDGFRPSFLGHILVELLLDASLIESHPRRLDEYYSVMDALDAPRVAEAVALITGQSVEPLAAFIPRFSAERFLYDYLDDGKLLTRLNHVMRRVGLPALPASLAEFFPEARQAVEGRRSELLAGEAAPAD
ncbi:MAG: hypothetical protein AB7F89_01540 [Pirellulaceae bacterium]